MIRYTHSLNEPFEVIAARLKLIARPYDDYLFMDFSLNTAEYRIVDKEGGKYMLYIVYRRVGMLGMMCNYKSLVTISAQGNVTEAAVDVQLKRFALYFYALFLLCPLLLLFKDSSITQLKIIAGSLCYVILCLSLVLFIDYVFYKRKLRNFFNMLTMKPPKDIVDQYPDTIKGE